VAIGVNATQALVVSQVVLSLALPAPMIALVLFTRRRDIMGAYANSRATDAAAIFAAAAILVMNALLAAQTFGLDVPFLSLG